MSTGEIIGAIIYGIVAIVGLLFVLWGSGLFSRRLNSRRLNWKIRIGVPIAVLGIFALSLEDSGFGNALSVVATLVLAFAAFWSVSAMIEYQRSTASEQRDLEFKRRSMDEVIQWAREVQKQFFIPSESAIPSLSLVRSRLYSLTVDTIAIVSAAVIFGQEFESKVKTLLEDVQRLADEISVFQDDSSTEKTAEKLHSYITPFWQSAEQVLKLAYELKVESKL